MLNIKNKIIYALVTSILLFCSCQNHHQGEYKVTSVTATHIKVSPNTPQDDSMTAFLSQKVDSLSVAMSKVISYSPRFLDKKEPTLGAWLCDVSMEEVKKYLASQGQYDNIKVALFNAGGMRTTMPQGDINLGFVYEFMPFENSYVLVTLDTETMKEMLDYLAQNAAHGIFHPLGGVHLVYHKDGTWDRTTTIGQWRLTPERTYTVLTTDFLLKGGDNMNFFAKGTNVRPLGIKMREGIMDYLTSHDTINIPNDKRYELN
ncbi:MAG: 5'-nucleotidase C-terminal domain-containing protein [Flavobacteriales bacterium]|nr:5'-nucleotidase C-terminal domain-containing protein [Flavobacteriales bacterium]